MRTLEGRRCRNNSLRKDVSNLCVASPSSYCGELCLDLCKPYVGVCGPEGRQFDADCSDGDSVALCRILLVGRHVEHDPVRVTNCRVYSQSNHRKFKSEKCTLSVCTHAYNHIRTYTHTQAHTHTQTMHSHTDALAHRHTTHKHTETEKNAHSI